MNGWVKFCYPNSPKSHDYSTSSIESIFIPKGVIQIQKSAFYKCSNLKKVEFNPNSELSVICESAFECSSLESIVIQGHSVKILNKAFSLCENLRTFEFVGDDLLIDELCFNCENLYLASFPNAKLVKIHNNAFENVSDEFSLFVCVDVLGFD